MKTNKIAAMLLIVMCVMISPVKSWGEENPLKVKWITELGDEPLGDRASITSITNKGKVFIDYGFDEQIYDPKFSRIILNENGSIRSKKENIPIPCNEWRYVNDLIYYCNGEYFFQNIDYPEGIVHNVEFLNTSDNQKNVYRYITGSRGWYTKMITVISKYDKHGNLLWEQYITEPSKSIQRMFYFETTNVFYIHSLDYIYEYDAETGNLIRKILLNKSKRATHLESMQMDNQGNFYLSIHDNRIQLQRLRIKKYNKNGKYLYTVNTGWVRQQYQTKTPVIYFCMDYLDNFYLIQHGKEGSYIMKYHQQKLLWKIPLNSIDKRWDDSGFNIHIDNNNNIYILGNSINSKPSIIKLNQN